MNKYYQLKYVCSLVNMLMRVTNTVTNTVENSTRITRLMANNAINAESSIPNAKHKTIPNEFLSVFDVQLQPNITMCSGITPRSFHGFLLGGRRSPAAACWASDHWALVRTHSGASFVINFASLSPASAWPSLA